MKDNRILLGKGKRDLEMKRGTGTGTEIGRLRIRIESRRETFINGKVIKRKRRLNVRNQNLKGQDLINPNKKGLGLTLQNQTGSDLTHLDWKSR